MENLITKLSKFCLAIKTIKSFANKNIVKPLFCIFTFISKYVILFWENSTNLKKFLITKKEQ
jgi:hypothetical protein